MLGQDIKNKIERINKILDSYKNENGDVSIRYLSYDKKKQTNDVQEMDLDNYDKDKTILNRLKQDFQNEFGCDIIKQSYFDEDRNRSAAYLTLIVEVEGTKIVINMCFKYWCCNIATLVYRVCPLNKDDIYYFIAKHINKEFQKFSFKDIVMKNREWTDTYLSSEIDGLDYEYLRKIENV